MIHALLSEFIEEKMEISTPFLAYLGKIPIEVFFINERTACIQIIGQTERKIVRHDLISVEERRIRKRPADALRLMLKEARDRGRANRLKMDYL